MWRLGGLSIVELLKRTARESWQDDVFGQAARLAFYHFLAIFPVSLLLLILLVHMAQAGPETRHLLGGSIRQFLPAGAALLVTGAINDLDLNARRGGAILLFGALGAVWAGINAAWAMIVGLNIAYETKEDRHWGELAKAAAGLATAVVALVFAALVTTDYTVRHLAGLASLGMFARMIQWAIIVAILWISFALFYRFGPNLRASKWHWSTPGAVFAIILWLVLTLVFREYFNRFAPYQQIYGRAASAAILLMWLYVTSATVLIGAELNSEIDKANESRGRFEDQRRALSPGPLFSAEPPQQA